MQWVFFAIAALTWTAVQANKPGVYTKWPTCKTGTEYVLIIAKTERKNGTIYHERQTIGGNIKYYLCRPCTQCLSGIKVLSPCSVRADTECSAKCAVDRCVVDGLLGCVLPGDPNDFENPSDMMDPCDPTMVTTVADPSVILSKRLNIEALTKSDLPEKPTVEKAEGTSTTEAPVDIKTSVLFALFGLLFIMVVVIICYIARQESRNKGCVRSTRGNTRSTPSGNTIQLMNFSNSGRSTNNTTTQV